MHWHVEVNEDGTNVSAVVTPGDVGPCCDGYATWKESREADE